jgi:hypothetical protein
MDGIGSACRRPLVQREKASRLSGLSLLFASLALSRSLAFLFSGDLLLVAACFLPLTVITMNAACCGSYCLFCCFGMPSGGSMATLKEALGSRRCLAVR